MSPADLQALRAAELDAIERVARTYLVVVERGDTELDVLSAHLAFRAMITPGVVLRLVEQARAGAGVAA